MATMKPTRADIEVRQTIVDQMPRLRAIAYRLTRNHAQAEDVLHNAFVLAMARSHQFAPGTNCRAWVSRILVNSFYNDVRRSKLHGEILSQMPQDQTADANQMAHVEFNECRSAIRELPAPQRQMLQMAILEGNRYEKVAQRSGIAIGTVKSRLFRARAKLRDLLADPRRNMRAPLLSGAR
ncbi:sigma-70 family RNA polymerase sigma factor [Lacibacterium aquatile]|uniref:Sigma-70 family RNA polymerase sigma factor n=1 Tax=Lacibacterium aquatile TaxID=1168082 RepID=A0ABW5DSJ5_9PROT